jgi:hypothetical protein
MVRNNVDGIVPVVVQQAILFVASASLHDVGNDKSTGQQLAYALQMDKHGLLALVMQDIKSMMANKCSSFAGHFDGHGDRVFFAATHTAMSALIF